MCSFFQRHLQNISVFYIYFIVHNYRINYFRGNNKHQYFINYFIYIKKNSFVFVARKTRCQIEAVSDPKRSLRDTERARRGEKERERASVGRPSCRWLCCFVFWLVVVLADTAVVRIDRHRPVVQVGGVGRRREGEQRWLFDLSLGGGSGWLWVGAWFRGGGVKENI